MPGSAENLPSRWKADKLYPQLPQSNRGILPGRAHILVHGFSHIGAARSWSHGLSISGPLNYADRDQMIPARQWYTWDSPNLMTDLPGVDRVTKVTVGGSGWDFQSRIGRVWLRGKH